MANATTRPDAAATEEDCLACRLTGTAAFTGLGGVVYVQGHGQLRQHMKDYLRTGGTRQGFRWRQRSISGLAAGLVGLGIYRLLI